MGSTFPAGRPETDQYEMAQHVAEGRPLCAICERRLGKLRHRLEEASVSEADVATSSQSWLLCHSCFDAVQQQLASAPVRSPLRIHVAVGMVASERTPAARRAHWDNLGDRLFEHILPITIALAVFVHLVTLIFIIVAH